MNFGQLPDGRFYYTMKEVIGSTLSSIIEKYHEGAVEWTLRRIVQCLLSVCDALAYAHERSVLHRDIKPDNICFSNEGHLKLLDFGLCKEMTDHHKVDVSVLKNLELHGNLHNPILYDDCDEEMPVGEYLKKLEEEKRYL